MKKIKIFLIIALMFCTSALALQLADYPQMFAPDGLFDPIYVIGEEAPSQDVISATILANAITKYPELTVKVGTSRVDTETSDITKYNAIVIGNPCVNKAAAQLEGNPDFCYEGLEGEKGYAKLFINNGKIQLLITGISALDRKEMAKFFANNYLGNLRTKIFSISTRSGSKTPIKPVQLSVSQTNKNIVPYEIEEGEEIEVEEVIIDTAPEKEEVKEQQKEVEEEKKPVEEKGFFGKIFSAIGNFFKNLFS